MGVGHMRITIDTKVVTRPIGMVMLKIGGWLTKDSAHSSLVSMADHKKNFEWMQSQAKKTG